MAVTANDVKVIGQVMDSLLDCSDEEGVDAVFSKFDIDNFPLKTMLLRHTMQVQEVFDAPNESHTDEDEYMDELRFFLDGKWKELV